jgi:hypothetical protein
MWDKVNPEIGDGRETEIETKYWKEMSHIVRFDKSAGSVWKAVDFILG